MWRRGWLRGDAGPLRESLQSPRRAEQSDQANASRFAAVAARGDMLSM